HATEFDVLKASHKFLRDDTEDQDKTSWNDQLAQKYYSNLFREFAVCDLKHYKSGNFSLRWRTESEVLSGAGETTCGNTRCIHHQLLSGDDPDRGSEVSLVTLELPFAYEEHGEMKSALVKVVLCSRCSKKLMWKRNHEKGK
ncbi:folate-sensitive fragile site protein Fra10Ac1, partial [Amylostereum chailletii]